MRSQGYALHLDFSKGEYAGRLSGFLTETVITVMLQTGDYAAVDMVSLFLGALVDRLCGVSNFVVSKSDTKYVYMVGFFFRRHRRPGRTEMDVHDVNRPIENFKRGSREIFGLHQSSFMENSTFHDLDYLVDDLRATGGIEYFHVGKYERSHKHVK